MQGTPGIFFEMLTFNPLLFLLLLLLLLPTVICAGFPRNCSIVLQENLARGHLVSLPYSDSLIGGQEQFNLQLADTKATSGLSLSRQLYMFQQGLRITNHGGFGTPRIPRLYLLSGVL